MSRKAKDPSCDNPQCPGHGGLYVGVITVEAFGPLKEEGRTTPLHFGSLHCLNTFVKTYVPKRALKVPASFDAELDNLSTQANHLKRILLALKASKVTSRADLHARYGGKLGTLYGIGPAALPVLEWLAALDGGADRAWYWETLTGLPLED